MSRARILLADDYGPMLQTVRDLLEAEFEVVGVVRDGQALVEASRTLAPDVIVTDIGMPRMTGLQAAACITGEKESSRIVFLTMHTEPELIAEGFACGGGGYVLKHTAAEDLPEAIHAVLEDRQFVSPALRPHSGG
ncbi:MAG TPA: response regulator transcription factor [Armatimonadota bacterium]|nr:response regulator transcription factor [Armatimonadota bacterium]